MFILQCFSRQCLVFSCIFYHGGGGVGKGEGNRRGAGGIRLEGGRRESLLTNQDEVSQSGERSH